MDSLAKKKQIFLPSYSPHLMRAPDAVTAEVEKGEDFRLFKAFKNIDFLVFETDFSLAARRRNHVGAAADNLIRYSPLDRTGSIIKRDLEVLGETDGNLSPYNPLLFLKDSPVLFLFLPSGKPTRFSRYSPSILHLVQDE